MYYIPILAVGVERLLELLVAKRNARWTFAHCGKEWLGWPMLAVLALSQRLRRVVRNDARRQRRSGGTARLRGTERCGGVPA
jgi:hypothetical protein